VRIALDYCDVEEVTSIAKAVIDQPPDFIERIKKILPQ
jgi:hypothetical protein